MSGAAPQTRGLIGFLDALRDGQVVVGWAADPRDPAARPVIRLMRGLEVLAECTADVARDDGNPGFRLRAPVPLAPEDFLEGRVRVRALLPGHHAATTLAMTRRMREQLESAAGWEPTTQAAPPAAPRPAPAVQEPEPPQATPEPDLPEPDGPEPISPEPAGPQAARPEPAAPEPAALPVSAATWSAPGWVPRPPAPGERPKPAVAPVPPPTPETHSPVSTAPVSPPTGAPSAATPPPDIGPDTEPPLPAPLAAMNALARLAEAVHRPVLHLLVPVRGSVLGGVASPGLAALEALAAARPLLARDWVPLRHAFARQPQPATLWRLDGASLTVEGCVALLTTLLAVLQLRHPKAGDHLLRAAGLLARADLVALPRRDVSPGAGGPEAGPARREAFLGVSVAETEPALPAELFADLPAPRATGPALPGLEAWSTEAAPLPWRVVVLAEPGLGGSDGPARIGWWLRRMVAECVISEALHIARPEAALGLQPDLVLTLAAEPR